MKIAILSPIAWRTPPVHYGPWELVTSNITEGLVAKGHDVTLFATADSLTSGTLRAVAPTGWEHDRALNPKVWECLHIADVMERASEFDIIHNNFDFLPLSYSRLIQTPMITTIHGFSSPSILPVYRKYDDTTGYVSISDADRSEELTYLRTVYNGVAMSDFTFHEEHGEYLLFFGRIHPDKGTKEAIQIARKAKRRLVIAGIVQDRGYFESEVQPEIDGEQISFIGPVEPHKRSELLGKARALLHPINFDEPFGLSVAESMACGTPVIATYRGSMGELIRDGETGFLTSGGDQGVQQAAERVDEVPLLSRHTCREWVEARFSTEKMVEGYLNAYEKLLSQSPMNTQTPR